MSEDLFGGLVGATRAGRGGSLADSDRAGLPLAVRMRPRTLDEIVGQEHLLAPGSPLRRLAAGEPMSVFLWGPPGTGKTTIAAVVSPADRLAGSSSCPRSPRGQGGPGRARPGPAGAARAAAQTVLFVDEVHRFSKTQQDVLLPGGGEPAGHPDRGHHREPELLGDLAAAVPLAAADPAGR